MHLRVVKTSMMTTYLSNIPDELKRLNNWCVWKFEKFICGNLVRLKFHGATRLTICFSPLYSFSSCFTNTLTGLPLNISSNCSIHEWKSDDDKPSSNNAFAGGEDINDDDLPF
jgi:hypothetical protein